MSKIIADSIVIVMHRREYGWNGEMVINGDSASGCNAPSAGGVLDAMWSGSFYDDVSGEAVWTLGEGGLNECGR